ncbi:MAG: MFS transporter [Chloroflexi bacterium]|nr:MFS transporter [Chloroflexota bacterium]
MQNRDVTPASRRSQWAWYLYDFGNSAYAAVVLLAVYAAYFQGQVVGGAEGSRLWGLSVGLAMLVVALSSPILGTIADFSGSKKRFLFFFTAVSCVFTALLFFVKPGDVLTGMVFFIVAEVGYRSAQVFYNALLPEIATPEELGRVSGNGWAIGSAGGIVCLLIILPLIMLVKGTVIVRVSFLITAIFFAASTIPIWLWLKEKAEPQPLPQGETYLSIGWKRLVRTFRAVTRYREFVKFMVAFLVYNDGIIMALDFAAILGAVLYGLNQQQLIIMMIIVQFTSVAGAWLFGLLAERLSFKRALVAALIVMLGSIVWMFLNRSAIAFFAVAALAGFALTGVQSLSRAMAGIFAPAGRSAEFYGFFATSGRTSSFIGPTIYGWIALAAARWYEGQGQVLLAAEQSGHRVAILSIGLFLIVGLVLLTFVDPAKGLAAAALPEPGQTSDTAPVGSKVGLSG